MVATIWRNELTTAKFGNNPRKPTACVRSIKTDIAGRNGMKDAGEKLVTVLPMQLIRELLVWRHWDPFESDKMSVDGIANGINSFPAVAVFHAANVTLPAIEFFNWKILIFTNLVNINLWLNWQCHSALLRRMRLFRKHP